MIIQETGTIADGLHVIGNMVFPGYVLTGDKSLMFDSGISAMGETYLRDLKKLLGNKDLDMLLLTHAHFDHIGSVAWLKKQFPDMKIGASPKMRDVLNRPEVIQNIKKILHEYDRAYSYGPINPEAAFDTFDVDIELHDGMEIDVGKNIKVQAIETPGHTSECYCFYIPHIKAIVSGESLGMPDPNLDILPEFLSSYDDYMESLKRMSKLDIDMILLPHGAILTAEHASDYIDKSITASEVFKDKIMQNIDMHDGDVDKIIESISQDPVAKAICEQQGKSAFELSLKAQIKAVQDLK